MEKEHGATTLVAGPSDAEVLAKISSGQVWGLAVSGKLASGKDTIAALALQRLVEGGPCEQQSWAMPLKNEMDQILAVMRNADSKKDALGLIVEQNVSRLHAQMLMTELWEEARNGAHARSRTPKIRWALQYLGTDIRREQHPDYWVTRAIEMAKTSIFGGSSVFFTDCRFPNEVEAARKIGLYTVRLEVSEEVQRQRLRNRDGLRLDPVSSVHPSETALDGYNGFDVVVNNDGPIIEAVEVVVAAMRARAHRYD